MRSFKIFVYKNEYYRILLTQYSDNTSIDRSLYSTFNEKITFNEHDQISLTFDLMKYVDSLEYGNTLKRVENQYYKLLSMGQLIELVVDDKDKYLFVISGIKPILTKSNVQFQYTCQDQVSYQWSRRSLGMSYSTVDEGGVQNIYTITTNVLRRANITDWYVVAIEKNDITDGLLSDAKITLEVADSNPYNIILEACNALNAYMKINYTLRQISFYQRDKVSFSGYRYRPNINLRSLDVDYDMEDMATIMHVYGGTDENNQIVSISPPIPDQIMCWWSALIQKGSSLPSGSVEWIYDIIIDEQIPNKYSHQEESVDRKDENDEFIAYGYSLNNEGHWVPVLYRTDIRYYPNEPFYDDLYMYVGTYTYNGIEYDRWQKYEKQFTTKPTPYYALTNLIVGADTIYPIKPTPPRIDFHTALNQSYCKTFIQANEMRPFYDNDKLMTLYAQFVVDKYYIGDMQFNIDFGTHDPLQLHYVEFINLDTLKSQSEKFQNSSLFDKSKFNLSPGYYAIYIHIIDQMQGFPTISINSSITRNNEINNWLNYTDRCPALGNFLYNFDFFERSGLLTVDEKNAILAILENNMAYNNMWLKYYEPYYWRSYSQLYLTIQEAKSILDNLQLARISQDATNIATLNSQYQIKKQTMNQLLKTLYDKQILRRNFDDIDAFNYDVFNPDIDILQDLVNEYVSYLRLLQECDLKRYTISFDSSSYNYSTSYADREYYTSQYYSLLCLVGSGWGNPYYNVALDSDGNQIELNELYQSTYPTLIKDIWQCLSDYDLGGNTLYYTVRMYQNANDTLWTNLYRTYSTFLYESKYENSDELDSTGLFNQASKYYEDYYLPSAKYSIGVIDIHALEQVSTDRLSVGSKIKVYNSDLNLNEGENEPLNNIQFTNNDLIVTGLSYELRQPDNISVNVEKIASYQSILQKLIQSIN